DTDDEDYAKKFASNNDDPIWGSLRNNNNSLVQDAADKTGPSYTFVPDAATQMDSIRFFNNQIRLWKEALAQNEREKYEAFALNVGNVLNSGSNTSIGKASISREFTSTRSTTTTRSEEVFFSENVGLGFTLDVAGSGFEFNGSVTVEETKSTEEGNTSETATTIGYTLNDGDDGDLISVDIVDPKTGNGHMFKLRAGQTSCPYEGPEWSHYYKPNDTIQSSTHFEDEDGVKLSDGTAKRHVPKIQIPQPYKFNVPADQPATFTLQLGNESESDDDQEYTLRVVEVTNPNGAVLTIDGLDPNRNFTVPFSSNISKTLSIKRGTEYYDYDSILLVFKSPCDDDLVDSAYVSVHFIPTCTEPVVYNPGDKWTLNNSFRDTMSVIINGYDYNFGGFKDVTFQYKPASSSQWNILQTFKKVPTDILDREIPSIQPYIEYAWNMKQLPDGPYDIRAVTNCNAPGHADSKKESSVSRGLADRVNPSPFGNPSPADGILSPNDEIQIQFNEPVDNASLSYGNFDIRGVLNGSALQNTASLYFDGNNDYVEIPTGLNLTKKSFSLEFWVKRKNLGEQVVFSQGIDNAQFISIGFDAADKFNFRIGNEKVRSNLAFTDTISFHHFTVSYNFEADLCELFIDGVVSNTGNTAIFNNYEGGGKTFIGKLSKDNSLFYKGNLRDMRLWTKTRSSAAILGSINQSLKGTEAGIIANWRLDEANGTEAKDYIRARHATIKNAVWEISPKGSGYRINNEPLIIGAADIAFTQENDFTVEFWFKGANANSYMSLFSNGKGDSTDVNPEIKWNIEKDPDGKIFVRHRGLKFEAVSTNYFDGNWHHFALVMQRATSITTFIDGQLQKSTYPGDFKQFGGNKIWVGARAFQPLTGGDVLDRTFNGYVDEVRIWNSARTQAQVERDRVNRLSGTETGLVFYLPFETYVLNLGVPLLTPGVSDVKTPARVIVGSTMNGSGLSTETPTIKLQRPVQSINFTYSVNQDKIILTPTTLAELIENVTLDITVKDVYDLNGNKMQSPRTWIAYVDKNQVKWQDQEFSFEKKAGQPLSFSTNIVNSGGAIKTFNLQNLPAWLTANPSSANISPNSFKTVTFTIDPNVNIGTYENEVQLLTDFGYPDGLLVKLKVYAEVPSNWAVNSQNYQNSMSIVGQVRINNVISTNADDKLAVFVNGECRGIANLQYFPQIDRYYAFLNVYSNVTQGETLEFKIWNASAGKIHADVIPQIQFVSNGQIGTISAPQIFNATDKLSKLIPLAKGWNWVSFNLAMKDSSDINRLFSGIRMGSGDIFRSLTTFADYTPADGWVGSLANPMSGVKPEKSYRLRSTNVDTLVTNGVEIDPTTRPIRLDSGWNWLGFISQRNLSVTESFSSLNAVNGDMIKSQSQFALYDENIGWVGSLTALIPSKGYMFRSGANNTFAYPRSAMFGKKSTTENVYNSKYFSVDVTRYENNMSAVVDAGVCNEALNTGRFSLGAYSGTELRGATTVSKLVNGKNLYFLNISSNNELEKITFRLLDEETGKTYELEGNATFESNKLIGNLSAPQVLKNAGSFNCTNYTQNLTNSLNVFVYPNPFNTNVILNVQGFKAGSLQVKIVDIAGKVVDLFNFNTEGNTTSNIDWNPEHRGLSIKQGIYFVEIGSGAQVVRTKIIKY
ncbi:MAG: LamG-like jellyroll fold domain-containing protein, partial [Bacteroidota bacterium]